MRATTTFLRYRALLILFCCLCGLVLFKGAPQAAGAQSASGVITVVCDDNYPPYIFRGPNGRLQGILVDQWELWQKKTGKKIKLMAMDWGKAKNTMAQGKADVIDTIFKTPSREKWLDFTEPYANIDVPIFFDANISGINDAGSLKGFTVGVKRGDACIGYLAERGITQLKKYPSYEQVVRAAAKGDIKVFCVDKPAALYYLYKMNLEGKFKHSLPLYSGQFHRAVKKGCKKLLAEIEKGFKQISPKEYAGIDRKWMGSSLGKSQTYFKYSLYTLLAVFAVVLVLVLWNRSLRKRVSIKTAELRSAMEALEQGAKKYRELVESANSIILKLDAKGHITFLNEFGQSFFGYSAREIEGKYAVGAIVPQTESTGRNMESFFAELLASPEGYSASIYENITSEGRRVWVSWTNQARRDQDGKLIEVFCVGSDITEQRLNEQALRESEERLRLLTDNLKNVVVYQVAMLGNGQRQFNYVSGSVEHINEVSVEEVLADANALYGQVLPEYLPEVMAKEEKALATQETFRAEIQCRLPSGRLRWFDITSVPRKTQEGALVWDGVQVDITGRKLAEQALKESEERFRILSEESPLGIGLLSEDGWYKYLNPEFTRLFGYTLSDIPHGRDWLRLAFPDPEYRRQVIATWFEDRGKSTEGKVRMRTFDVTCKNGEVKTILFRPVTTLDNKQFIIYEDITDRILAENKLRRLEEQLFQSQKMEALGILASGIAHDFNNVLQAISGYVQLIGKSAGLEQENRERLKHVGNSIERAAGMIRQLMTMARKAEILEEEIDLNQEVQSTARVLEHTLPRMIRIQSNLAEGLRSIKGDANQIEQVLLNLGTNAGQAMPQGGELIFETRNKSFGPGGEEELPGLPPGNYVELKVKDSGQGMNEETLGHIFEPFFTTKPQGEGTGLGLSTAYGIINNHGGRIFCQSQPGRGTVFAVYLPAQEAPSAGKAKESISPGGDLTGSEKILLVDDEKDIIETSRQTLEYFGYKLLTASSGEEALEAARQHDDIALVVLDLNMPGMGGMKCLGALAKEHPGLKVMVSTGYADEDMTEKIRRLGGLGVISKPYRADDLLSKVRGILDARA